MSDSFQRYVCPVNAGLDDRPAFLAVLEGDFAWLLRTMLPHSGEIRVVDPLTFDEGEG